MRPVCGGIAVRGEQVEERADPVSFLGGVPEQVVAVHGVPGAPARHITAEAEALRCRSVRAMVIVVSDSAVDRRDFAPGRAISSGHRPGRAPTRWGRAAGRLRLGGAGP
jgi:hypothetical protein